MGLEPRKRPEDKAAGAAWASGRVGQVGEVGEVIDLFTILAGKWGDGTRPKDLYAAHVSRRPAAYAELLIAGLEQDSKRVQNGCAELAALLSADHPALLYPHFDRFAANLGAKEPVLRWEAACTIGNLAAADTRGACVAAIAPLIAQLGHESIVLQGHSVRALAKIAKARPEVAPGILQALIAAVPRFPDNRVGFLVEAMAAFADIPGARARAAAFAASYAGSAIKPVAAKARRALARLG